MTMNTKPMKLDGDHCELVFTSSVRPTLLVTRLSFDLHRLDIRDTSWSSRLAGVMLKHTCVILDKNDPTRLGPSMSDSVSIGARLSPHHMHPIFDLRDAWHFLPPMDVGHSGIEEPQWETTIRLEGFHFQAGEAATLWVATDAMVQARAAVA